MDGSAPLTFMFTDIVGSTALWQEDAESMHVALEAHDRIIKAAVESFGGDVFAGGGDGFGVVFSSPSDAVAAASEIHRRLSETPRIGDLSPLEVRIGIHTGAARERDGDFFGLAVSRAARVADAAHGGQTLVSHSTASLVEPSAGLNLVGTHRLADLQEPITLHQVGTASFPPPRVLDPQSHNLPVRFTSFVGREDLVESILDALDRFRLVTLVGPGGVGKTSAATAAAARRVADMPDGVWLVELDEVGPSEDPAIPIARALGVDPSDGWEEAVAERRQIVILDNAEHLLSSLSAVASRLLRAGPGVVLLVTSREALAVPGERLIEVPPLDVHAAGLDLFRDRVTGDTVDPDDAAEMVSMSAGLPLGIELIAGHASRMPSHDLLESLDRHGLASLRVRGVTPRHASSDALIGWSFDMLSPEEKRTFAMLAVFAQDFSMDDARALTGGSDATIRALVEKSLVHRADRSYRLLEPIREFAVGQIDELGLHERAVAALAERVASVVDATADRLPARPPDLWLEVFKTPYGDVRRAFARAIATHDISLVQRLYRALPGAILRRRAEMEDLFEVLEDAVPLLESGLPETRWALYRHAFCEDRSGRESLADPRIEAIRSAASVTGDAELEAACDALQLSVWNGLLDISPARFQALSDRLRETDIESEWWEASGIDTVMGVHALSHGDPEGAEKYFRVALGDSEMHPFNRQLVSFRLAEALRTQGRDDEAVSMLQSIAAHVDDELAEGIRVEIAHAKIAIGDLDGAFADIGAIVDSDPEPSDAGFCPAADYFRAIGDHRTAVWFLARMLEGEEPRAPVHHAVVAEARAALGEEFENEWRRGERMELSSLRGILREE